MHETASLGSPELAGPLVLASASPRREAILRGAGFRFAVAPAADAEAPGVADGVGPQAVAQALAVRKAATAARDHPGAFVLGADTVVALDGALLGKPADASEAREMLRRLRGRTHVVVTGVAVAWPGGVVSGAKTTLVRFRGYSDGEIEAYIRTGSSMDKAGAYGIQDRGFAPAASVTGCYLNVVGLPLCLAVDLLVEAGALLPVAGGRPRCYGRPAGAARPGTSRPPARG